MGIDNPSGSKQSLPSFTTNVRISGGDQSYVNGPGFHYKGSRDVGKDLTGLGNAISSVADQLKRQQEENQNRQRAVDAVRLQTETQLDLTQAYDQYKNSYNGPDEDFSKGWMEQADKYVQAKRMGIQDSRLLQEYDKFQMPYIAQNQLKAMDDENQRYTQTFKTNVTNAKQNFDDLLAMNPTPETLDFVVSGLDSVYEPIKGRLRAAGQEDAANNELAQEKEKYAVAMFQYMAKKDPDAAMAALHNPDSNQYLRDPDTRQQIEGYIERLKGHQVDGLRQEFTPVLKAYQEAMALGKDASGLLGRLQMYTGINGVVQPEEMRQIQIAQQMAAPYAELRAHSVNMSDTEFEDALARMRDDATKNVDEDLPFRLEFHDKAVAALRNDRVSQKRNPIDAMGELTGADPQTARMQYIAARLSAGENVDRISVLNQVDSENLTKAMHNAVAGNRIGDIMNVWQQMKQSLSTPSLPADRAIVGDISMMDMALSQMARTTQDPLSKNVIAALSLLPSGQEPSADNVLLKAAFVTPQQENGLLQQVGLENMSKLGIEVSSKVPEWNLYFKPTAGRSVRGGDLMTAQQNLMLRTVLLNMATGQYGPSGGFMGIGQTSGRDNAIKQTIKGFLPFSAANVNGSSHTRVQYQPSQLLIPTKYEGTVDADKIKGFVGDFLNRDSFWHQEVGFSGVRPDEFTAVNKAKIPQQINQWLPTVQEAANAYKVPAWLVAGVMFHESGGNAKAMGAAQDSGLMQIIPPTFAGVQRQHPEIAGDIMDPRTNIMAGAAYLGDLYHAYKGDLTKVLRNYNGGPSAVYKPNAKVLAYVPKVMQHIDKFRPTEAPKPTPQNTAMLDYARRHVMDAISLENNDDFSGMRIMVNYQGRKVPLPGRDGNPINIPFEHVSRYVMPKRDPDSIPTSFLYH